VLAGNKRPSFLKRQKEQQRTARAAEKREARRLRKQGRVTEIEESGGPDVAGNPVEGAEEPEDTQDIEESDKP